MALIDPAVLRHRITIAEPVDIQTPGSGLMRKVWVPIHINVPAEFVPSSVREFIASQSMQSEIIGRFRIRYREGLTAKMRIEFRDKVYNVAGWLADPDSGIDYLTAPVSEGANDDG